MNPPSADALLARLIKLTKRREDFITECFAAVLQADGRAARQYWRAITANGPKSLSRATGPISVETQKSAGRGSSRLDMVVGCGGRRIGVEHKLMAPQGKGQLRKYVKLPGTDVSYVVLVTGGYQQVSTQVLSSRRYLRPSPTEDHFLWSDFYRLLQHSAARGYQIAKATIELFDKLGLQPTHPLIGDLRTADLSRRLKADQRLKKAWQPLVKTLRGKKWSVGSSIRRDRKSEVYVCFGPSSLLREVWLDPQSSPSSLRVRLKTSSRRKRDEILAAITRPGISIPYLQGLGPEPVRLPPSVRGNHWAVEFRAPWGQLLRHCRTRADLARRLRRFVLQVMRTADPGAV